MFANTQQNITFINKKLKRNKCLKQYKMKNTTSSMGLCDTLTNLVIYSHT